jgi:hypothetical protein
MKTILLAVVILLALVGVLSIVLYVVNHKASVQIKQTSLIPREIMTSLPRESIKSEGAVKFTSLTHGESNSLALIEDQSLLGLTAGAFNPRVEPLSSSEQKTLKTIEEQKLELQNMTAGDLNDQSGIGTATYATVIIVVLLLILIF